MLESVFYHNTTRSYTVAFGSIFNGIRIERQDKSGNVIGTIPVPLIYSEKEKFWRRANELSSIDDNNKTKVKETLPKMGFELLNMNAAPNRKTNTMNRIVNSEKSKFMFNRSPWDFQFALYIAARRIDDALRIVEQIIPYFDPELNIRIRTMKDFPEIVDDIPIVLDAAVQDINNQGTFDERRTVGWELQFTLKGYLYCNVRDKDVIRKTIVDISDKDLNTFYEGYLSRVDPLYSDSTDEYDVIEEIITEPHSNGVFTSISGSDVDIELG